MVPECFGSVWVTFAGCEEVLRLALTLKAKVESLSRRKPTWIEKIAVVPMTTMMMTLMMTVVIL